MSGYGIILIVGLIVLIASLYSMNNINPYVSKKLNHNNIGDEKTDPNDLTGAFLLISWVFGIFSIITSVVFIIVSILGIITYGI